MNQIHLIFVLFFATSFKPFAFCQTTDFEGTIGYTRTQSFDWMYGDTIDRSTEIDTITRHFKNGNWIQLNSEKDDLITHQHFLYKKCKIFSYNSTNTSDIYESDFMDDIDFRAHSLTLNADTILGIPCHLLFLEYKEYTLKLWMNHDSVYSKGVCDCFKLEGIGRKHPIYSTLGIPLKSIYENKNPREHMKTTLEAILIENSKVDESLFKLPTFDHIIKD
jgi:hypothetical protein